MIGIIMLLVMLGGLIWWTDKIRGVFKTAKILTAMAKIERSNNTNNIIQQLRANRQVSALTRMTDDLTAAAAAAAARDPFDEIEEEL